MTGPIVRQAAGLAPDPIISAELAADMAREARARRRHAEAQADAERRLRAERAAHAATRSTLGVVSAAALGLAVLSLMLWATMPERTPICPARAADTGR